MKSLENKIENSVDLFLLACKECGFKTKKDIEENFEIITIVALSMMEASRDNILTKIASKSHLIFQLSSRYKLKVLENDK